MLPLSCPRVHIELSCALSASCYLVLELKSGDEELGIKIKEFSRKLVIVKGLSL